MTHIRTLTVSGVAAVLAALSCHALAQSSTPPDPTALIDALKEGGKTRGLDLQSSEDAEKRRKLIEALQKREKTRGLSVQDLGPAPSPIVTGVEVQEATADRPKSDIEVYFDYNSAVVTAKAEPALNALGKSLSSKELKGQTFLLAGHTDAKGSADYNKELSEQRALAVKRYLVSHFDVPEDELAVIGHGKDKLKLPEQPFAAENRRVEVVNMGQVALKPADQ